MGCCNSRPPESKHEYTIGKSLGEGGFAKVYECVRNEDGLKMACKDINLSRFQDETGRVSEKIQKMITEEIRLMKDLSGKHPVLLEVYDVKTISEVECRIYLEICRGRDLYEGMFEKQLVKTEGQVREICEQLTSCLAYLHSKKILHLDVKPENVAFVNKDPEDMTIKLLDFGLAKQRSFRKERGFRGTREYMAPELALQLGYTEAADMWSIGTMMYEMLFAESPFQEEENHCALACIIKLEHLFDDSKMKHSSENARDLITHLLKFDAVERLTAKEALKHPFFTEASVHIDKDILSKFELFARRGTLQRALLPIMKKHSEMKINFLRENLLAMHKISDINGDGVIDFNEFQDLMEKASITIQTHQAKQIFDGLLQEDKTSISVRDLLEWFEYDFIMSQDERLWDFMSQLDEDGNGQLSHEELEHAVKGYEGDVLGEALEKLNEVFVKDEVGYETFAQCFRDDVRSTIFDFRSGIKSTMWGNNGSNYASEQSNYEEETGSNYEEESKET